MKISNAKFPLYSLPKSAEFSEDYPYKLISSGTRMYVLDTLGSDMSFTERRLKLLNADPGYPIYKLRGRCSSLAQVINSKNNLFIDSNGDIFRLKRDRYYPTKVHKVLGYDRTHDGKFLLFTLRNSFVTSLLYNYVVTITFNGADVLVGGVNNPKDARKRYKI